MSIGENLKKLRLQKGLTQEQTAEAFGVSAQAVSRWENDTAYPDITMLGGIAAFYDTSVDALLNVDALKREENLRKIHAEAQRLVASGEMDAAEGVLRAGLWRFPAEAGLMLSLAETLAHKKDEVSLREAVRLSECLLEGQKISLKARCTTMVNLLFLYRKTGQGDKAQTLILQLPHIWESREVLMIEAQDGAAYEAALRTMIEKILVFLCMKMDGAKDRDSGKTPEYIQLGVDFSPKMRTEDMLEKIRLFVAE